MLGPIFFLVYVKYLPDLRHVDVPLFADDVKLVSERANFDDLQRDLQQAWDLPLNENKCGHIFIG